MTISGPIIDADTGVAVTADVYVDGKLVQEAVTDMAVTIPLSADRRIELRVEVVGYQPWAVTIRDRGKDQRMEGPVRMVPVNPSAPAEPPA
jgi:hypothetical protein